MSLLETNCPHIKMARGWEDVFACIRVISLYVSRWAHHHHFLIHACSNGYINLIFCTCPNILMGLSLSLYISWWVHQCHLLNMSPTFWLEYSIIFVASLLRLVVIAFARHDSISSAIISLMASSNYDLYLKSFHLHVSCAQVEEMNLYLFGQCTKLWLVAIAPFGCDCIHKGMIQYP